MMYTTTSTATEYNLFTDSCKHEKWPCLTFGKFVDPCNCTSYYECITTHAKPILRPCAPGTAWDDIWKVCDTENDVYVSGICTKSAPWDRCQKYGVLPQEILKLKNRCLSQMSTSTPPVLTTPEPASEPVDTGLIVGAVIGSLILVALVILLALLLYRWKDKIKLPSKFSVEKKNKAEVNEAYSEPYEIYDTIDVHSMRDSVSSDKPVVSVRPVHTFPYSERPNSDTSLKPPSLKNVTSDESYSPMVTPRNSKIESYTALDINLHKQVDRVPTEYSEPYEPIEMTKSKSTKNVSRDSKAPPDYVDFGHYDTDYTLATQPT